MSSIHFPDLAAFLFIYFIISIISSSVIEMITSGLALLSRCPEKWHIESYNTKAKTTSMLPFVEKNTITFAPSIGTKHRSNLNQNILYAH